ncbi:MAG: hypothetical protein A1D16_00390 [Flavihumibacter sp. CACIAM 22H1]|nr:MAG: hypothetical protein A1D16_00390 [Flavihumibacter sp. CACIAM 22H1]
MKGKRRFCLYKPFFFMAILSIGVAAESCQNKSNPELAGAWQIDSVFDFYNGFTFMDTHPTPREVHVYQADKTMLRRGMGEEKLYYYELDGNRLFIRDLPNSAVSNEQEIVRLDSSQLVLRKNKKPQFEGRNQERYELRYFSRVKP